MSANRLRVTEWNTVCYVSCLMLQYLNLFSKTKRVCILVLFVLILSNFVPIFIESVKQSLPCNNVHQHRSVMTVAYMGSWLQRPKREKHKSIVCCHHYRAFFLPTVYEYAMKNGCDVMAVAVHSVLNDCCCCFVLFRSVETENSLEEPLHWIDNCTSWWPLHHCSSQFK